MLHPEGDVLASPHMSESADAIVIGAGVQGAALAFHLARRGVQVTVLERGTFGGGATGRSSGLVRMHYDVEPESRLAWASFRYFRDWPELVGGECGFTRTGFLKFVAPPFRDELRANVAMQQRIGIPTLLVTAPDVRRLAPMIDVADDDLAAFEPESGYADPTATTAAFLSAARALGAHLVQGRAVTEITTEGGRVTGVRAADESYPAGLVVDAAGAWAGEIAKLVGLALPLQVWRHDVAYISRPAGSASTHPTVIDDAKAMYFRPEGRELTLVALEDGNEIGDFSPDRETSSTAPGFAERVADRLTQRMPAMAEGTLHSVHSGQDGITPDQHAIIGQAGPDGFYLDCGFSGTGFKIAPAVGESLAELICTGRNETTVDLAPFALARFAEDRPLVGEHAYEAIWR
jgi:sarcosine oxidase, subunit beta